MDDVTLAKHASLLNKSSRIKVNEIVYPIINSKTTTFCKKYCQENKKKYTCTLPEMPYPPLANDSPLCEWGNASYAWMLDDLTNSVRLEKFRGDNGASLKAYFQVISNSIPFRERWKDWRFKNRVYAPSCVKSIHQKAPAIFYGLHNQKSTHEIAQNLKLNHQFVDDLSDQIMIALTKTNKLHLLLPKREVSLTGFGLKNSESPEFNEHQGHIPYNDCDQAEEDQKNRIKWAWKKLNCVEQFVLEEMLIENEDAFVVLESLNAMNISIKKNVAPEDTNRQQLFYFRRKALRKLAVIAGLYTND
ncbi:MAG: hypothetical protein OEM38_07130 [Gammaproteobacteria bacterium]|nr:hypothetical protein [Gammaproteobacteria bacterium]